MTKTIAKALKSRPNGEISETGHPDTGPFSVRKIKSVLVLIKLNWRLKIH